MRTVWNEKLTEALHLPQTAHSPFAQRQSKGKLQPNETTQAHKVEDPQQMHLLLSCGLAHRSEMPTNHNKLHQLLICFTTQIRSQTYLLLELVESEIITAMKLQQTVGESPFTCQLNVPQV